MEEIRNIFIGGAVLFGVSAIVVGCIFAYFIAKNYTHVNGNDNNLKHVHWLNSIWIYMVLFTSFLLFTALYSMSATQMGFTVKPNMHVAYWSRWLFLAVIGLIYNGCLAFIMTDDDATWNKNNRLYMRVQSFFIVLYYVAAILFIYFATGAPNNDSHIVCMVASIVTFIISVLLYFFPYNKMSLNSEDPTDYVLFAGNRNKKRPVNSELRYNTIMTYRGMFLGFIILSYVVNVIIWFLSTSNDISDVIDFKGQIIAYLVSDIVFIVLFAIALIVLTFYFKMKTVSIKGENGGHTQYKARAVQ